MTGQREKLKVTKFECAGLRLGTSAVDRTVGAEFKNS